MLLTTIGNLVGFWWMVVNSPEPKISRPLENCSPIFSHANTRFKQALWQLEAKHPRRFVPSAQKLTTYCGDLTRCRKPAVHNRFAINPAALARDQCSSQLPSWSCRTSQPFPLTFWHCVPVSASPPAVHTTA